MTVLSINTASAHPKPPLKNPSEIQSNPLAEKISEYAACLFQHLGSLLLSFRTGELSTHIYEVIQVSLSVLGCAGYSLTLLLCIGGFVKLAIWTALFSTGNFVGAYVTYQAVIQQSIERSARGLESQVGEMGVKIVELNVINKAQGIALATSEKNNEALQSQVGLFTVENRELTTSIANIKQVRDQLHQNNDELRISIQTITQKSKVLEDQAALFKAQNQQFRALGDAFKQESAQFCSSGRNNNHTQAELLQKFEMLLSASHRLWEDAQAHSATDRESQAALIAQQTALIEQQTAALSQLRDPELRSALRKDIEDSEKEHRELRENINIATRAFTEVQERMQAEIRSLEAVRQRLQETVGAQERTTQAMGAAAAILLTAGRTPDNDKQ